jgi:hypothetical protein
MLALINGRHGKFPSFSHIVEGLRDHRDLLSLGLDVVTAFSQDRPGPRALDGHDLRRRRWEADFSMVRR